MKKTMYKITMIIAIIIGIIMMNTRIYSTIGDIPGGTTSGGIGGVIGDSITGTTGGTSGGQHTTGEVITEADNFVNKGKEGSTSIFAQEDLQALSNTIYNILLIVGIVLAVLLGAILGIKFMLEGAEGKAEVQKALVPYVAGCIVVFGAFTIWKIVVLILQGLE